MSIRKFVHPITHNNEVYKVYEASNDWFIVMPDGSERWFSKWTDDIQGSFDRVINFIKKQ